MPTQSSERPNLAGSGPPSGDVESRSPSDLGQLYAQATARRGDRSGCPTGDTLVQFSHDLLRGRERADAVQHLADCSDCSREVQAIAAHPTRPSATPSTELLRQRPLLRWSALAAAAGLVLTLTIGFFQTRAAPPSGNALNPTQLRSAPPSAGLLSPSANEELTRAPEALTWHADNGEVGERVRLLDSNGEALLDVRSETPGTLKLDEELRQRLDAGGRFVWTVDRADGSQVGPQWFVVLPPDEQ